MGRYWILFCTVAYWLSHEAVQSYKLNNENKVLSRKKRWEFQTFRVPEERRPKVLIARLHSSADDGKSDVTYSISGVGVGSLFEVEPKTGQLYAISELDREITSEYILQVSARDSKNVELEPSSEILIEVDDINDNPPVFSNGIHHVYVKENSPPDTLVTTVKALDADDPEGPYGEVEYSLVGDQNTVPKFRIVPETGEIYTTLQKLDRETQDSYQLIVKAIDDPYSILHNEALLNLTITVTDVNDNPPVFEKQLYQPAVFEDADIGSEIVRVTTTDQDETDNKLSVYSIVPSEHSDKFAIDTVGNEGVLKLAKPLDYETAPNHRYTIEVKATNNFGDSPVPLSDICVVEIRVQDADEAPAFDSSTYQFHVSEDAPPGTKIGDVHAADPENHFFLYYIEDMENVPFTIDQSTGSITLTGSVDREEKGTHVLTVTAGKSGDPVSIAMVTVVVGDINDNPPRPINGVDPVVIMCINEYEVNVALPQRIILEDVDSSANGTPFQLVDQAPSSDFSVAVNEDDSVSVIPLHDRFSSSVLTYELIFTVQDSGTPAMNATIMATVELCKHCTIDEKDNHQLVCDPLAAAGFPIAIPLIIAIIIALLIIIVIVALLTHRNRRQRKSDALLKGSMTSDDEDDIRENMYNYDIEGGGEEDNANYDIVALQRSYIASSTPPSSNLSKNHHQKRAFDPSQLNMLPDRTNNTEDMGDFINQKKAEEDQDDSKLAHDSLQIYSYEGEGSSSGSLSSLGSATCSDEEQDYDYLQQWGPRFKRLADMYG